MTIPFMHEDFLLGGKPARELYHAFAEPLPVIDYHCHLSPGEIACDRRFANLAQLWLESDHYKWRAMRAAGVDERFITGDASDWEKFRMWSETVPRTLRNPLYHWTHLELKNPFGITDRLLNAGTAKGIWEECNEKLTEMSTREILRRMNVRILCTTDDPVDNLAYHRAISADPSCTVTVLPTFRADRSMAVDDPPAFVQYVGKLALSAGMEIRTWEEFLAALRSRHGYFHSSGCRLSDHGLESLCADDVTPSQAAAVFDRVMKGGRPDADEARRFGSRVLYELAVMDWETGWTQQLHLGALRNTNSRGLQTFGPDAGFDSIGDGEMARPLARFLDRLDCGNKLAKTILYNLNPRDNELFAAMAGNFQDGSVPGKIQYGAAWWFLDQREGIERQIGALSAMGLLSRFVGMLTDSRCVLSFSRHEYFRRLLCNILGDDMERGLIPFDMELVGAMVKDICFFNAQRYFNFTGT